MRVATVIVETVKVVEAMKAASRQPRCSGQRLPMYYCFSSFLPIF